MSRPSAFVLMSAVLVVVGCAGPPPSTGAGGTATSKSSTAFTAPASTLVSSTFQVEEADEPPEFTEFTASTACGPDEAKANLQVVQAFVNAYNDRDEDRLAELFSDSVTVDDLSGLPHLPQDSWADVAAWANEGWEVDDRFELTRLVMYNGGAVFNLVRSNDVLRANNIEELHHLGKTRSSRCLISRLVLYLPSGEDASDCRFWDAFAGDLSERTTQTIAPPESCVES